MTNDMQENARFIIVEDGEALRVEVASFDGGPFRHIATINLCGGVVVTARNPDVPDELIRQAAHAAAAVTLLTTFVSDPTAYTAGVFGTAEQNDPGSTIKSHGEIHVASTKVL